MVGARHGPLDKWVLTRDDSSCYLHDTLSEGALDG